MIGKEKAFELIEKFGKHVNSFDIFDDYDEQVKINNAKNCALVFVNEILNEYKCPSAEWMVIRQGFWENVKSELESLEIK